MRVFGIVGWKNSGKTTLVSGLIGNLRARGLRVASVKHTHHDVEFDQAGKDSYLHREAGAGEVLLISRRRWALFHEFGDHEPDLPALIDKLAPADVVLIEGFKQHGFPKIQVFRRETGNVLLVQQVPGIVAVASDVPLANLPVANLNLDDIDEVSEFILAYPPR